MIKNGKNNNLENKIDNNRLLELIKKHEGPKLEHKGKDFLKKSTKDIAKIICSFMNAKGGILLIGVADNKPDGLIFKQKDEERITQLCRDLLNPPQTVNIEICEIFDNNIAIIEIVPSRGPVQVDGRYYKRVGSTTRQMTPEEIKRKYIEAEKLYKILDLDDANKIVKQKQLMRDIILDENKNEIKYLTFDSFRSPIVGGKNIVYGSMYESFDERSKLIFTTLHNVTIEELTKILAQFYKIFGDFSQRHSYFGIEQAGFNWVGLGPQNFIETIKDQKNRYKSIKDKYGDDFHIHHRETAFFIEEIADGIFFISCEPNNWRKRDTMTIDYFDVGFVLKEQPFSRLFNEFFNLINIEPFTVISNDKKSIFTERIEIKKEIPFKIDGFIQSVTTSNDKDKKWVSGAYGKLPDYEPLVNLGLNKNILVNILHQNLLEDDYDYHIERVKYTKFELGCFSSAIVDVDID